MTLHRNGFEGQTNDTGATVANSGASGDAWTGQSLSGGTLTYSTASAASGAVSLLVTPVAGSACFFDDNSFNSTSIALSDCFYYTGAPSADMSVAQLRTSSTWAANLAITTAGKLVGTDSTGTWKAKPANALVAGHWYRFEMQVFSDASAGTIALQYYLDNAGSAVESVSASACNTLGDPIQIVRRGFKDSSIGWTTMRYDNIQAQDGTTTPIGAYGGGSSPGGSDLYAYHEGQWVKAVLHTYKDGTWQALQ